MKKHYIGILLALFGSLLYSTKAIFVKLAYQYDVDTITILALRMLSALPFYLLIQLIYRRRGQKITALPRHWAGLMVAAFLGYYLASFLDFWGLQFIDASVERLILFTYPTFIVIIARVWLKEPITKHQLGAIALSYIGLLWVFSPQLTEFSIDKAFLTGATAILGCAVSFALYMIMSQQLISKFGATKYTGYAMTFACCLVIGHYAATESLDHILSLEKPVYLYGFSMGIIATVIPSYMINAAINAIGASRTAIIASVGPVSTITLAYFLLDERLTWAQWTGTAFIILSVTFISLEKIKLRKKRGLS
ncbi:MAG: EamA/RhaT family transporter [Bacteroidetes bacterium]|nr:MAG: EamA/RhaT family transporter [Bacteroidota bacterium]